MDSADDSFLIFWKGFLEIPGSFFSKQFAQRVIITSLWVGPRVRPITINVKVFLHNHGDCRGSDHAFLNLELMTALHNACGSVDSWFKQLLFGIFWLVHEERRGSVDDIVGAFTSSNHACLVVKIGLNQLKVFVQLSEGILQRLESCLVLCGSDSSSHFHGS